MKVKKNLLKSIFITTAIASITISGTFAWYVARTTAAETEVETAWITTCATDVKGGSNLLPGENLYLEPVKQSLYFIPNTGSADFIAEVTFEGQITALLPLGTVVPQTLINQGDYVMDTATGQYRITQQRIDQIVKGVIDITGVPNVVAYNNRYYYNVPVDTNAKIGKMYLNIQGELGGLVKDTNGQTISRQFEQQAIFAASYKLTAVQKTPQALIDVFGQDAFDHIPAAFLVDTSR